MKRDYLRKIFSGTIATVLLPFDSEFRVGFVRMMSLLIGWL